MTMACVGAWGARVFCFQQQARYHHRQVDLELHESAQNFSADLPYSQARWERVRQHLHLACVYDYAASHPWLTLADAHAEVNRIATPPTTLLSEGTNES